MPVGRDRRFYLKIKNKHHYHVDMFLSVIDRQLGELNDRFDEVKTYLHICKHHSILPIDLLLMTKPILQACWILS